MKELKAFLKFTFYLWTAMVIMGFSFALFPIIFNKLCEVEGDIWYVHVLSISILFTGIIWSGIILASCTKKYRYRNYVSGTQSPDNDDKQG